MLQNTIAEFEKDLFEVLRGMGFAFPEYATPQSMDYVNSSIAKYYENICHGLLAWRRPSTKLEGFSVFTQALIDGDDGKTVFKIEDADHNQVQHIISSHNIGFEVIIMTKSNQSRLLAVHSASIKKGRVVHFDKNLNMKAHTMRQYKDAGYSVQMGTEILQSDKNKLVKLSKPRIQAIDPLVAKKVVRMMQRKAIKQPA